MRATTNNNTRAIGRTTLRRGWVQRNGRAGFTLIEVLVVVAIIALLISILLPSLQQAREQARITKCLSNQANLARAVYSFAAAHKGYGQAVGEQVEWEHHDPSGTKYAYQTVDSGSGQTMRWLKSWQAAYAHELTMTSVKRNEDLFDTAFNTSSSDLTPQANASYYHARYKKHDVLECPSDEYLVKNAFYPCGPQTPCALYGAFSYSANEDVFGLLGTVPGPGGDPAIGQSQYVVHQGYAWIEGGHGDAQRGGEWLGGRLDKIVRPSEVVLFSDGGNEKFPKAYCFLLSSGSDGPLLEDLSYSESKRLPIFRHGQKGGLVTALADGSGRYAAPLRMGESKKDPVSGERSPCVLKFAGKFRVSPYNQ